MIFNYGKTVFEMLIVFEALDPQAELSMMVNFKCEEFECPFVIKIYFSPKKLME